MKLSISLSDALESPLKVAIKSLGGPTVSLLIETAVAAFLDLKPEDQAAALQRRVADRAAVTRSGWARSFWQLLGSRMDVNDLQENELAPRQYKTHIVVMLLPAYDRYASEDEGFTIHATPKDATHSGRSTWTFERGITPSFAADSVAKWLNVQRGVAEG
jgi:hypothetical protein